MSETIYKYEDYMVEVEPYPVDGSQVRVREWDGKEWNTLYNKRVIAESYYEMLTSSLVESGIEWEDADYMVSWVWEIYPPMEDEEND
jgi:hypothetical protein